MKPLPSRSLVPRGRLRCHPVAVGLSIVFVICGIACTNPGIENVGGTGGAKGTAGATAGATGTGGAFINTSKIPSTGGATGTTLVCNSTSTNGCKAQIPEGCGDGINNQGGIEQCDDGNVLPGDGCSGACKVEKGWTCPPAGRCTRVVTIVCGDGQIGAGEVCDDGNTVDGDGCNATCTVQDPAFICVPGKACVRSSVCGNKRIEAGEDCDDGNTVDGDGCSGTCQLEAGWVCPNPGQPCKPAPRCGDGIVQPTIGEVCDDGNQQDGDGCSADCKNKGAGCACTPGKLCSCPVVKCGNGVLEGSEKCDDGNTAGGDGCAGDCSTVEPGFECRVVGKPCTPKCGDGILSGNEECEYTTAQPPVGCTANCRIQPGYDCDPTTHTCAPTVCGNGVVERGEQCDDGNTLPFDGCYQCRREPSCTGGKCVSSCGDGQRFADEACDDGNLRSGDGCSSACKLEPGFTCTDLTADPPDNLKQPVLLRDFAGANRAIAPQPAHPDFNSFGACPTLGMVLPDLGSDGHMVLNCPGGDCKKNPGAGCLSSGWTGTSDNFDQWYHPVDGVNLTLPYVLTLQRQADGSYLYDSDNPATTTLEPFDPIGSGGMVAAGKETLATDCETPRNVSFTTETHFWFEYQGGERFDFSGDDDVWVFANRKLVIDMGGLHQRRDGYFILDADTDGNGPDTADGTAVWASPDGANHMEGAPTTAAPQRIDLGMAVGGIYEVVVFQAERKQCESNFRITLRDFAKPLSQCVSRCGDGVVVGDEQCDCGDGTVATPATCPGPNDKPAYGGCTSECKWGPYCGDGKKTDGEECDNGVNNDDYGATNGCAAGCKLPPRCGDSIVQTDFDEECDEGANNQTTSDPKLAYGGCLASCKRGGRCGDGVVNGPETCDDGVNDGTYGTCNPDCTPAPKCGDGVVQADFGEECEPTMSNDPNCTQACRRPGGCGDGVIQPPEQCDDGAANNNGEYGGCAPSCIYAPHCGDGIVNGPEECDDGVLDGSYGGCTPQCKLAPHCGDGIINGPEECDHGDQNGADGLCSKECKTIIFLPR